MISNWFSTEITGGRGSESRTYRECDSWYEKTPTYPYRLFSKKVWKALALTPYTGGCVWVTEKDLNSKIDETFKKNVPLLTSLVLFVCFFVLLVSITVQTHKADSIRKQMFF